MLAHQRHYELAEKVMASTDPDVSVVPTQNLVNTSSHPLHLRVPVIRAFAGLMEVFQYRVRLSQVKPIIVDCRHLRNAVDFFEFTLMLFLHDYRDLLDCMWYFCQKTKGKDCPGRL